METIEILNAWKLAGRKMDQALTTVSFHHMLHEKSRGILTGIRRILKIECLILVFILLLANCLFVMVNIPLSILRWGSFILFNIVMLSNIIRYLVTIHKLQIDFTTGLLQSLGTIITSLNRFKKLNWLFRFPFIIITICMFGIMQMQIFLVPWFIIEYFLWWWITKPFFDQRFHRYVDELDLSRRVLMEV